MRRLTVNDARRVILALDPCPSARRWLETLPDDLPAEYAWMDMEQGATNGREWRCWLAAGHLGIDCACESGGAASIWPYVEQALLKLSARDGGR